MRCKIIVRLSKITVLLIVFLMTCGSGGYKAKSNGNLPDKPLSVIRYQNNNPSSNNVVEDKSLKWDIDDYGGDSNRVEKIIPKKRFTGIANMTIQYYRYDPSSGHDVFVEEKVYRYNVHVFTDTPLKIGSIFESNPINISIYPDRDPSIVEEGHIDIKSAALCSVNTFSDLLLQYWNLTLIGEKLNGTLTDTHRKEAAAANLLWAWEDVPGLKIIKPFPIAKNTTMQGVVSNKKFKLKIQGETTDTYRKFVVKINGQREGLNQR